MTRSAIFALIALLSLSSVVSEEGKTCSTFVPDSLQVPSGFSTKEVWHREAVLPLADMSLGKVETKDGVSVSEMIHSHTQSAGSIAFVVRRPG